VRNIPIQLPADYPNQNTKMQRASASPRRTSVEANNVSSRKASNSLDHEVINRRLSEAGVNRRPSAARVLTEDTDSFIVGDSVFVDGIKPGRIQYIGVTKFGPGDDWAGVFLDEPIGKNDGSVGTTRYFTCEPKHGVFSKLHRLTREPIEGAQEALQQIRKYGYEVLESDTRRRRSDSTGSGGGRRDSMNLDEGGYVGRKSSSPYNRYSVTPEPGATQQIRRDSSSRYSPDSHSSGGSGGGPAAYRRPSTPGGGSGRTVPISINRKEGGLPPNTGGSPAPGFRRGKSPYDSPRSTSSNLELESRIEKDPELVKLTSEARRLSMGGSARRTDLLSTELEGNGNGNNNRAISPMNRANSPLNRANSPLNRANSPMNGGGGGPPIFSRKTSESLGLVSCRSRSGSESENNHPVHRKASSELSAAELQQRRLSEAGLRRPSAASEVVLNEDTSSLMVGMTVWVDGTKKGRIAYIGEVHFAKGEWAGVHLDTPRGKNNGTVGGIMYFQCEAKRGVFSKLNRLTPQPLVISDENESGGGY